MIPKAIPLFDFFVPGKPLPQGSKVALKPGVVVESGGERIRNWRAIVQFYCEKELKAAGYPPPIDYPVRLDLIFLFERPKKHFKRNGELRDDAPSFYCPRKRNDRLKLARAIEDALTDSRILDDDAYTVAGETVKRYVVNRAHEKYSRQGVIIKITDMRGADE